MLTLIIKQSQYTKQLERAISTEIMQSNRLTIAGMSLFVIGVKLDLTLNGENSIEIEVHIPEKLTIPNE